MKTGMGASPSWVRIPLSPPRKTASSSYPGIILIDHRACPNRRPTRLEMGAPTRAPTQALTDCRRMVGEDRVSTRPLGPIWCSCSKLRSPWGRPPQRRFINPLCGCRGSAAGPPAPIDPPTMPTETRRTGRARSLEVSERVDNRPAAILASQSRGPAVPEQAHLAPAAPLWGPMYPPGNIQRVLGWPPVKEFIEF